VDRFHVSPRQRHVVLPAVRLAVADLALGLLARDLIPRTGHLDGDHDGAHHGRGDDHIDHGVQDRTDD
jgi:hypothetical protein